MIRLSRVDFADMQRLVSLGTLIHGLIHNLNGPLQNLGMDMDMIGLTLESGENRVEDLQKEIRTRLGRMEEEFTRITHLIRSAASRTSPEDEETGYMNLGDFLQGEIDFLKANLYFKHHVKTDLSLEGDLPSMRELPPGTATCLRGFLQAVVEELERRKMGVFSLKAPAAESGTLIRLFAGEAPFSAPFLLALKGEIEEEEGSLSVGADQLAATHAGILLGLAGIRPEVKSDPDGTLVTLRC